MKTKRLLPLLILPLLIATIACTCAGLSLPSLDAELGGVFSEIGELPIDNLDLPGSDEGAAEVVASPVAGSETGATVEETSSPIDDAAIAADLADLRQEEATLIELYERVIPGVVSIVVQTGDFGGGQGSGFVLDTEGHIVTNDHVVADADLIEVTFFDGRKAYAELLGTDVTADIAILKVDLPPETLTPVPLGNSDVVLPGQRVVAIGNPFGLEGTMTLGIVSGLGRTLIGEAAPSGGNFSAPDIIQTDAAINPGNSGGPLFNLDGEVIGINRAIATNTGASQGVGFAVAVNTLRKVAPSLIATGVHEYSYLGISGTDAGQLTLATVELLDLPDTLGVYVVQVVEGGPSDQAGLMGDNGVTQYEGGGDFITHIDGQPVRAFSDVLSYLVNNTDPGQTVVLTVIRDGETLDVPVVLGVRP